MVFNFLNLMSGNILTRTQVPSTQLSERSHAGNLHPWRGQPPPGADPSLSGEPTEGSWPP